MYKIYDENEVVGWNALKVEVHPINEVTGKPHINPIDMFVPVTSIAYTAERLSKEMPDVEVWVVQSLIARAVFKGGELISTHSVTRVYTNVEDVRIPYGIGQIGDLHHLGTKTYKERILGSISRLLAQIKLIDLANMSTEFADKVDTLAIELKKEFMSRADWENPDPFDSKAVLFASNTGVANDNEYQLMQNLLDADIGAELKKAIDAIIPHF